MFPTFVRWTIRAALAVLFFLLVTLAGFRLAAAWREAYGATPPRDGRLVATPTGGIFIQTRGPDDGPALLMVPGTAAWSGFWLDIADALGREGYRAIAIDLPPFGFSDRSMTNAYSRKDQAERISALIATLDLKSPIVIGHSFGAGPVVEAAMRHANQIRGVVLVDGALGLPPEGEDYAPDNAVSRFLLDQPTIAETLVAATMVNPWLTRRLLAGLLFKTEAATEAEADILRRPYSRPGTTQAYARWLPRLLFPDREAMSARAENYRKVATPVALIWGLEDSVTPIGQGQRLQNLLKGSTLDIIDGVGHIPHIEDEQAFLTILKKRLKEIATR
jgi:pimeloyl-ACP methyl ester carboxylesterase